MLKIKLYLEYLSLRYLIKLLHINLNGLHFNDRAVKIEIENKVFFFGGGPNLEILFLILFVNKSKRLVTSRTLQRRRR